MANEARSGGSGLALSFLLLLTALTGGVFAFVPLVECRRCKDGQFSREMVYQGRPAIYIDYCDCGGFWKGGRGKITLLRSLQKPQSLKAEDIGR